MSSSQEFHMKQYMGVEICNPISMLYVDYASSFDKPTTQAERRRDKIVMRVKTRISWIRWAIMVLTIITGVILSLAFVLFLGTKTQSDLTHVLLGVLGGELAMLSFIIPSALIETNKYDISFKHSNKRY